MESAVQIAKDIYEPSLRKLLPNLIDAKVKATLKNNEGKMMIRFHTCLILIKYIEHVVRDATNMWKNIYHLHKPSDDPVEIKDDDDDSNDEEDNTPCATFEAEEEEEDKEENEEDDPMKIIAEVIVSLPHSPPMPTKSSGLELALLGMIVTTSKILFAPATS